MGVDGLFAAGFTCRGPEIDFCAPGVAVISTVPPNGYAAWDGTSMACPHVAGFAARLLQERQEIRDMPRTAARVTALVEAMRALAVDVGLPTELQGAGMPRLQPAIPKPTPVVTKDALAELAALLEQAIAIIENDLVKQ